MKFNIILITLCAVGGLYINYLLFKIISLVLICFVLYKLIKSKKINLIWIGIALLTFIFNLITIII